MMVWYKNLYLSVAVIFLLVFSSKCGDPDCINANVNNSNTSVVKTFTTTNCSVSNNNTACFSECFSAQVNFSVGMSASAECNAPGNGRTKILYNSPEGLCVEFQMDTSRTWLQYGEHIFFRKENEKIEVTIVNALQKHHNFSVNCVRIGGHENFTDPVPDGCAANETRNTATIYVASSDELSLLLSQLSLLLIIVSVAISFILS